MNVINLTFPECDPAPANGYIVTYRPVGGGAYTTLAGPIVGSPVNFNDGGANPDGTSFEGFVQADKGDGSTCTPMPWLAEGEFPPGSSLGSISIPTGECIGDLAITNIQYDGVDVVPIGSSFPIIPGQTMNFLIPNPTTVFPYATIKVFLADVPPTGVLSMWGTDANGFFSCDSGINPTDFELPFFAAIEDDDAVVLEIHCGECP